MRDPRKSRATAQNNTLVYLDIGVVIADAGALLAIAITPTDYLALSCIAIAVVSRSRHKSRKSRDEFFTPCQRREVDSSLVSQ